MTSTSNPFVVDSLVKKFGRENICWPLVWSAAGDIAWYTYERSKFNDVNAGSTNHPKSSVGKQAYFVDYVNTPRIISPENPELIPSVDAKFDCSYEYVVGSNYSTVDLDYVWKNSGWYIKRGQVKRSSEEYPRKAV